MAVFSATGIARIMGNKIIQPFTSEVLLHEYFQQSLKS